MVKRIIFLCVLSLCSWTVGAGTNIHRARMWTSEHKTRLVLDSTAPVQYRLSPVASQTEWKLDLPNTRLLTDFSKLPLSNTPIKHIRTEQNVLYLLLKQNARIKSFTLAPQAHYGHRLVLDFYPIQERIAQAKPFVIAIDAGHGGEDPGAVGKKGTLEKNITLAIARQLKEMLSKEPGLEPVMTRTGDYFLTLRQRIVRARKAKADIFVSIHADSGYNPHATGSSVYVLSERGASSEAARWLAHRENQSDLIGGSGISLKHRDEQLASVLLDLSMTAKVGASQEVANTVLESLAAVNPLHKTDIEHAGFVVLKSPDIPSILVETAFLSNPQEERKLKNKQYQQTLARALTIGLKRYVEKQRLTNHGGAWLAKNDPRAPENTTQTN